VHLKQGAHDGDNTKNNALVRNDPNQGFSNRLWLERVDVNVQNVCSSLDTVNQLKSLIQWFTT